MASPELADPEELSPSLINAAIPSTLGRESHSSTLLKIGCSHRAVCLRVAVTQHTAGLLVGATEVLPELSA